MLDQSVVEYEWDKYLPDTVTTPLTQDIFNIRTKDTVNPLLMQEAFLLADVQLYQTDGSTAIAEDNKVALVNTGAPFTRVVYKLNERTLTDIQDWHHCNLVAHLTESFKDYDVQGSAELWYPDTGAGAVDVQSITSTTTMSALTLTGSSPSVYDGSSSTIGTVNKTNPDYNAGFDARMNLCKLSYAVRFKIMVKDLCAIYKTYNKVVQGYTHTFELHKNTATSMVFAAAANLTTGEPFVVQWNKLELWVPHVKASDKAQVIYNQFFVDQSPYFHGFCDYRMYKSGVQAIGQNSYNIPVSATSQRPSQVYVFMSPTTAETAQTVNSMIYIPNGLTSANINVDGTPLMRNEYNPINFSVSSALASSDVHRLYEEYLKVYGKKVIGGAQITYDQFLRIYPIIRFDLSKLPAEKFSQKRSVDLSIELNFSGGATAAFIVHTMVCTDRILMLNPARRGEIEFSDSPQQP